LKDQAGMQILFTFVAINGKQKMITWSLQSLFNQVFQKNKVKEAKLPVYITSLKLSGADDSSNLSDSSSRLQTPKNSLIGLHPFIQKHYFSRHQHSFFYTDECITDQTFYVASDFPALVMGTNYGRVFIIQLFQDIECRGYPILTLDCHQNSPITCLYISYSTARKSKQMQSDFKGSDQQLAQAIASDSGGHLIACS
jgi:hypothetical protein